MRRCAIAAGFATVLAVSMGCFPEFTDWHSGGTTSSSSASSSATGGSGSTSSASTTGVGGGPTCEQMGGHCLPTPEGFSGPARLSSTGCDDKVKVLSTGMSVASPQTGVCLYHSNPEECSSANLIVSNHKNCDIGFGVSDYKNTPAMNACGKVPYDNLQSLEINTASRAQCNSVGDLPFVDFDNEIDLCAGKGTCANSTDRCVADDVGSKRCVWIEMDDVAQCPVDYPKKTLGQYTADAVCHSTDKPLCAPVLVVAPDCTLGAQSLSTTLEPGVCKDWPMGGLFWALEPGTVDPCLSGTPTASAKRAITLCCAQ